MLLIFLVKSMVIFKVMTSFRPAVHLLNRTHTRPSTQRTAHLTRAAVPLLFLSFPSISSLSLSPSRQQSSRAPPISPTGGPHRRRHSSTLPFSSRLPPRLRSGCDGAGHRHLLPQRGSGLRRPDQRPEGHCLLQELRPAATRPHTGDPLGVRWRQPQRLLPVVQAPIDLSDFYSEGSVARADRARRGRGRRFHIGVAAPRSLICLPASP